MYIQNLIFNPIPSPARAKLMNIEMEVEADRVFGIGGDGDLGVRVGVWGMRDTRGWGVLPQN